MYYRFIIIIIIIIQIKKCSNQTANERSKFLNGLGKI